ALQALSTIGLNNVIVTAGTAPVVYNLTFGTTGAFSPLAGTTVQTIVNTGGLTTANSSSVVSSSTSITTQGMAAVGQFTLTFNGQTTAPINSTEQPSVVQAAL